MPGRNDARRLLRNIDPLYSDLRKVREVRRIDQFGTPEMPYPTDEQLANLDLQSHIWSIGDRFYKLADEHYDDPGLWWVIAWINKTPTESHIRLGELIYIPLPLYSVLNILGY